MDWYDETVAAISDVSGIAMHDLELSEDLRTELLDVARIASHHSGQRINAPLICYALGKAVERGISLSDLARVIRERAGEIAN